MLSRKQCALEVITTMTLWQLMPLDTSCAQVNIYIYIYIYIYIAYIFFREGASLALVGHPSSDGVTRKIPYGVDVLYRLASHPIFFYWVG